MKRFFYLTLILSTQMFISSCRTTSSLTASETIQNSPSVFPQISQSDSPAQPTVNNSQVMSVSIHLEDEPFKRYREYPVKLGNALKVFASVKLFNGEISGNVDWSSSDNRIVTVNSNGTISAQNQVGRATIVATSTLDPEKKAVLVINVVKELGDSEPIEDPTFVPNEPIIESPSEENTQILLPSEETNIIIPSLEPEPEEVQSDVEDEGAEEIEEVVIEPTVVPTPESIIETPAEFSADWVILQPIIDGTSLGSDKINDMSFVNYENGWVVGLNGVIGHTSNAGASWSSQKKSDIDLYSVSFVDESTGWVAGSNGVIYKTEDGGNSWSIQDSTVNETIYRIRFSDKNNGIFTTQFRKIFMTSDGGENWELIFEEPRSVSEDLYTPTDLYLINENKALIYQWYSGTSKILNFLNSGIIFPINELSSSYIKGTAFNGGNTGYIWGNKVIKTENGGQSWDLVEKLFTEDEIIPVYNYTIQGMSFASSQNAVALISENGSIGRTYYTKDGGSNWIKTQSSLPGSKVNGRGVRDFKLFDLNHGWALIDFQQYEIGDHGGYLARLGPF